MAGSKLPVAIISDDTTFLEFETVSESVDKITTQSKSTSSGGRRKMQVAGYRLQLDVKIRMTPEEYNTVKILLTNGSLEYFYTPIQALIHPIYQGGVIPIKCIIEDVTKDFDNRKINYANFQIESVDLFRC